VNISVEKGTVNHSRQSLCESCRLATVIRGARLGDEIVECAQLSYKNQRISFPVTSCSSYLDRAKPTLRDMESIAWVLKTDPRRNQVGFIHSAKLPEDERFVL
jgi:hypothetical protein